MLSCWYCFIYFTLCSKEYEKWKFNFVTTTTAQKEKQKIPSGPPHWMANFLSFNACKIKDGNGCYDTSIKKLFSGWMLSNYIVSRDEIVSQMYYNKKVFFFTALQIEVIILFFSLFRRAFYLNINFCSTTFLCTTMKVWSLAIIYMARIFLQILFIW